MLDGTFADRRFQIGTHEREKAVISVASMRIDKIGAFQSSTSMDEAGTAGNLASEGVVGANKAGAASRVTTNDDLTITGLVGQATVGLSGGESAKRIVELVNNKFDNTGVSATATTTIKIEVNSMMQLEITLSDLIYMVKILTLKQFQLQFQLAQPQQLQI